MTLTAKDVSDIEQSLSKVFQDVKIRSGSFSLIITAREHNGHIHTNKCQHALILISRNVTTGINKDGYLSTTREPIKYKFIKHCICGKVMALQIELDEDDDYEYEDEPEEVTEANL